MTALLLGYVDLLSYYRTENHLLLQTRELTAEAWSSQAKIVH